MNAKLFASEAIPDPLKTPEFLLEPLHPAHVNLDFDAVMSSKTFLRLWSNSNWPTDNFTLADNLNDLQVHFQEFSDQIAYTYSILSLDRHTCLGCVYIYPIERIESLNDRERDYLSDYSAFVRFWMRETLQKTEKELLIFHSLVCWFKRAWKGNTILYSCNKQVPATIKMYRATGLKFLLELSQPNRDELLWFLPEEQ